MKFGGENMSALFGKRKALISVALLSLVAVLFLVRFTSIFPPALNDIFRQRHVVQFKDAKAVQFDEEVSYWGSRIARVGGAAAYTEFTDSASQLSGPQQHIAAHTFGDALYKTESLQGLGVCDGEFGWGCEHSFFGLVIRDHGVIEGLMEHCIALAAYAR